MYCSKCGFNNNDSAVFCAACGAALRNAVSTDANNQNGYQQPIYQQPKVQQPNYQPPNTQFPMKWWKFLVYFLLFIVAVVQVIGGIRRMTGSDYGELAYAVYYAYDGLKMVDIIYGLYFFGVAAWAIFTRQNLYRFKKNGPKMLLILYVIIAMGTILYLILYSSITGFSIGELWGLSDIAIVINAIVMISVNKVYFDKRASMFVN